LHSGRKLSNGITQASIIFQQWLSFQIQVDCIEKDKKDKDNLGVHHRPYGGLLFYPFVAL